MDWLSELKERIKEDFGDKCAEYDCCCATCNAWHAYEVLENLYAWRI
jgi:hypothetical protein